jgi:hypothetical protein
MYQDMVTKRLKLDSIKETLQYGSIIQRLPKDALFNGNITFDNDEIEGIETGKKNAILRVSIPIVSNVINGDYSINVVYQYDNRMIALDIPLMAKFTPATASANGGTGTFVEKNGSNYFVGANPNNWVAFGQVSTADNTPILWRIIKYNNDGIKIIYEGVKNGSSAPTANGAATVVGFSTLAWDVNNVNVWETPASLNSYLHAWYDSFYAVNKSNYVHPIHWCIGSVPWNSPTLTNTLLTNECATTTTDATAVGLLLPSEYISTSSSSSCTGSYKSTANYNNECGIENSTSTNFLYKSAYNYWTNTALNGYTDTAFLIVTAGNINNSLVNIARAVRPVINLKSTVLYSGGDGSLANPYTLSLP